MGCAEYFCHRCLEYQKEEHSQDKALAQKCESVPLSPVFNKKLQE
jgi:hypothetical protein